MKTYSIVFSRNKQKYEYYIKIQQIFEVPNKSCWSLTALCLLREISVWLRDAKYPSPLRYRIKASATFIGCCSKIILPASAILRFWLNFWKDLITIPNFAFIKFSSTLTKVVIEGLSRELSSAVSSLKGEASPTNKIDGTRRLDFPSSVRTRLIAVRWKIRMEFTDQFFEAFWVRVCWDRKFWDSNPEI